MGMVEGSVVARSGGGRGNEWMEWREVWGSEIILYDTIMMDTHQWTFVKIHRICNTEHEP